VALGAHVAAGAPQILPAVQADANALLDEDLAQGSAPETNLESVGSEHENESGYAGGQRDSKAEPRTPFEEIPLADSHCSDEKWESYYIQYEGASAFADQPFRVSPRCIALCRGLKDQ